MSEQTPKYENNEFKSNKEAIEQGLEVSDEVRRGLGEAAIITGIPEDLGFKAESADGSNDEADSFMSLADRRVPVGEGFVPSRHTIGVEVVSGDRLVVPVRADSAP